MEAPKRQMLLVKLSLQNQICCHSNPSVPQNMKFGGNGVSADVKCPINMGGPLMLWPVAWGCEDRETQGKRCDNRGRDESYVAVSPRTPKKPAKYSKKQERIPLQVSKGAWLWGHLHFSLSTSKTMTQYIFIVLST